ncbi:MAG: CDP-alcohol phosphatidyltransferase family protein [Proteobacteria bacterium]|nr:CDP-alcohol phosphatidyltransferase family protein [Pseudomonadota bacterium]
MIEHYFRPTYQKYLVDPCSRSIAKYVTPNFITCSAGVTGICTAPLLIYDHISLAATMLLISGFLDTLDGTLARNHYSCTPKGTILDIIFDRMVEASVVIGLFGVNPNERGWCALFMLASILICVTAFLVVGIFAQNASQKSFHYSRGLMERPEAFMFFLAMMILPNWFSNLAILFSILVLLTSFLHCYRFLKNV